METKRSKTEDFLNQLDVFDQCASFADAVTSGLQIVMVNNGSIDRKFFASDNDGILTTNKNLVNVQTLERCLADKIDSEFGMIVDMVEDRS